MLIIKQGGPVSTIHRRDGEHWYSVNKIYINKYDSIDISANAFTIILNENLYYQIDINVPVEHYVDSLLKQGIRQDKLEEILK